MGKISDSLGNLFSKGSQFIANNGKIWFKNYLKSSYKSIFLKSTIKYILILLGIVLVIFEPFGFFISHLTTSILFIGVVIWSLISIIKVIINYYKLPVYIISNRSIQIGTWEFIGFKWPKVAIGISGYNFVKHIGSLFSSNFQGMPEITDIVKDFFRYVLKDFIILSMFFILYFITINILIKPYLLIEFANLKIWEIYLFPFVQIRDFILYLLQ